jgi:hypothetical protein
MNRKILMCTTRDSSGFERITPVRLSTAKFHLRCLFVIISGGSFLAGTLAGCGSSETKLELTPEVKKNVLTSKIGDPSRFIKTGKKAVGKAK